MLALGLPAGYRYWYFQARLNNEINGNSIWDDILFKSYGPIRWKFYAFKLGVKNHKVCISDIVFELYNKNNNSLKYGLAWVTEVHPVYRGKLNLQRDEMLPLNCHFCHVPWHVPRPLPVPPPQHLLFMTSSHVRLSHCLKDKTRQGDTDDIAGRWNIM